ncbi:GNAT family N-acetyltransferase [Sphingobium phenoxybenzoativorans]|uniref:GNAT family N-acetyltransferase n=1 Tax=Sphingobium phenoxybenzoativorans TaxID=1592790 RepID=A0A975KBQ4_9SPHN|nr:GNAT family protein [Sphingobium phenoxybenzoativorans]QUT07027.1 GNAT family N-acetyltransferase [Sphingobium phenoxybenzoativorans]
MAIADLAALAAPLEAGDVRLELLAERHVEPLRAACARDADIWHIYPMSWAGDHFDGALAQTERFHGSRGWVRFAVLHRGVVVGMTNYIDPDSVSRTLEIGGTYIEPSVRGSGFNGVMKRLMIEHAFACGFTRIEIRVDTRNKRSMAAVLKLGAMHEGTLRRNRVTWTGYVRDTAIFGLLKEDWRGGY